MLSTPPATSPLNRLSRLSRPSAMLGLGVRVWVASQWLTAGWHKLIDPAWTDGSGRALLHFWTTALGTTPSGQPVVTYSWYRAFLQLLVDSHAQGWFARVITASELAVGLGLLLGACVGVAALGGLTLNMSYMLAGSLSTNPVLALGAGTLIVLGKHAGWIGLDRYLARFHRVLFGSGSGAARSLHVPSLAVPLSWGRS